MIRLRYSLVLATVALAVSLASSQSPMDRDGDRPRPKQPVPDGGFWPTPRLMELYIDRLTDEIGKTLTFDEDQVYTTRELFKGRFPKWLNDNRGEIQELTNEWMESLLAQDAPDPAFVAKWAQRAQPLFNEFMGMCHESADQMRSYMTEQQQVVLDGQLAVMDTGVNFLNQRLTNWSNGGFDAATEWPRSPEFKEADKERRRDLETQAKVAQGQATGDTTLAASAEPAAAAPGERPTPKPAGRSAVQGQDEWAQYVEGFIRRYQLNDEQKASAYKLLKSAQEQRDGYLRRNATRIAEVDKDVKEAKTDAQRAGSQQEQKRLRQPVDRQFSMLKERLDQIPTRKQRLAAAQTELERRAEAKPANTKTENPTP